MNATVSVQDLWRQILALPAADRHWLASKLYDYEDEKEHLTHYKMEELNARIDEFEAELEAGEYLTAEEANREVKEALPWLK